MIAASLLDQSLRSAVQAEAQLSALRPSVIRSEFFHDYTLKRILEAPDAAWFDLLHTRGVGGKSTGAVAQVIADQLAACLPQDWTAAKTLMETDPAAAKNAAWPVGALARFMEIWLAQSSH